MHLKNFMANSLDTNTTYSLHINPKTNIASYPTHSNNVTEFGVKIHHMLIHYGKYTPYFGPL